MPKRKRNGEASIHNILDKYQDEVFKALKASKGFERQRLSKRSRDQGITPDKVERLEREIAVLKVSALRSLANAALPGLSLICV
jgi:hypothetical protein